MNTTEHLELILAYCRRCLAIAEKRTPGMWDSVEHRAYHTSYIVRGGAAKNQLSQCFNWQDNGFDIRSKDNAAFIATCAGAAEAGWRATIASIEGIETVLHYGCFIEKTDVNDLNKVLTEILAAYPLELITP